MWRSSGKRSLALAMLISVLVAALYAATYTFSTPKANTSGEVRIIMTTFNWGFNTTNIADFQFGKIYDNPTITVKQGQRVTIELRTLDITHGFAIDELGVNAIVLPGETVTVSFVASKVGVFKYYCPVFCGLGHASMWGDFQVLP